MMGVGDKLNEVLKDNRSGNDRNGWRRHVAKDQKDETLSEKEIVRRVLAGEIELFENLVYRHSHQVT